MYILYIICLDPNAFLFGEHNIVQYALCRYLDHWGWFKPSVHEINDRVAQFIPTMA